MASSSSADPRWRVVLLEEAVEDLKGLDPGVQARILRALHRLEIDPSGYGKPLGKELSDCFKLRLGPWRVVYDVDEARELVRVIIIEHRERVYAEARRRLEKDKGKGI